MWNLKITFFVLRVIRKFKKFLNICLFEINKQHIEREDDLKSWYFAVTGQTLDLKNPKTFNEKIQWLKLNDSTRLKTKLADKYLVRKWIKKKIGEKYLIPLLGCWKNFDDINFDKLPNKFVLKCNHGSGYNIIVTDKSKLDIAETREKINEWMAEDYSSRGFEWHYSAIPRKIIAEEYIEPALSSIELQAMCFNGKAKIILYKTIKDLEKRRGFVFYRNWQPAEFKIDVQLYDSFKTIPQKPACYQEFVQIAENLAHKFYHVRVDFIIYKDRLLFREMTFTHVNGLSKFEPDNAGYIVGDMLKLPCKN